MTAHRITPTTITAVMVALPAALIARTIVQKNLINSGYNPAFAADLAYLVVPPILLVLLFPLWRSEKSYIREQFSFANLSWRLAIRAVGIGVLMRVAWWSQLFAGISFGIYRAPATSTITPLVLNFQCPSTVVIALGLVVMAGLIPFVEETIHRGYVQGVLRHRGAVLSVLVSAIVFTVFHRYTSWPFVFVAGLIFGTQYWVAKSLWPSLISHATINALIQLDWRCLNGRWNPPADSVPLLIPGTVAMLCLVVSVAILTMLIRRMATEARNAPR
ncbi:MAG TPA: type II CAAX endopeptidase family protein [Woeseiaceae bacterium]|nr:type II CAAX endopeptidase family protein [Woeseiaceae bacterium]